MLSNLTRQDSLKAENLKQIKTALNRCSSTGAAVAPFHQDLHQANSPDMATCNIPMLIVKQSGKQIGCQCIQKSCCMWKVCPEEALNHRLRVNARPLRKKVPHCAPAKHCRIKNPANEI